MTDAELAKIAVEWREADEKAADHRGADKIGDAYGRRIHSGETCSTCSYARIKLESLRIAIDEYRRTNAAR